MKKAFALVAVLALGLVVPLLAAEEAPGGSVMPEGISPVASPLSCAVNMPPVASSAATNPMQPSLKPPPCEDVQCSFDCWMRGWSGGYCQDQEFCICN